MNNRETATIIALNDAPEISELVNSFQNPVYFFDREAFSKYKTKSNVQLRTLTESEKKSINYDTLELPRQTSTRSIDS